MKNLFKNTFPLDKKYLSLAAVFEKWKKLTSTSEVLLIKTILFLLDTKFVSTSRNKEIVKKTFPFEGETVFTTWNI